MRWWLLIIAVLLLLGLGFYVVTSPGRLQASALPRGTPDAKNGEYVFIAGGCSSCHGAPPADAACNDPAVPDKHDLAGGRCLVTPFGTFYVPNISPDRESGIGGWTDVEFVNAMMRGVSPAGAHYYPAFPYTSYQRMRVEDVLDLKAFLSTLPAVRSDVPDHDLPLPFRLRRGLGLWKLLYLDGTPYTPDPAMSPQAQRGGYLVEGPGHCGECHTPRDLLGGRIDGKKLSGAANPEGKGVIPNITPHKEGIGDWSAGDIVEALATGFTPDFKPLGGTMTKVAENTAKLTDEDRAAIAAYLKAIRPLPSSVQKPARKKQ